MLQSLNCGILADPLCYRSTEIRCTGKPAFMLSQQLSRGHLREFSEVGANGCQMRPANKGILLILGHFRAVWGEIVSVSV